MPGGMNQNEVKTLVKVIGVIFKNTTHQNKPTEMDKRVYWARYRIEHKLLKIFWKLGSLNKYYYYTKTKPH